MLTLMGLKVKGVFGGRLQSIFKSQQTRQLVKKGKFTLLSKLLLILLEQ